MAKSVHLSQEEFEEIAQQAFDSLPDSITHEIDNVHIVVEDYPPPDVIQRRGTDRYSLLGLYEGVPLTHRGTWYGASPIPPDKISLYKRNIESVCRSREEVERRITEVLFHEIGHHFGMSEDEVREALKDFL